MKATLASISSPRLVLASASPRRRALLEQVGAKFEVELPDPVEAVTIDLSVVELVRHLAEKKAESVAQRYHDSRTLVIAADTLVSIGTDVLGKPRDAEEAKRYLLMLRGQTHSVVTGYTVLDCQSRRRTTNVAQAEVSLRRVSDREVESYALCGEPLDKAGGYAIQGRGALMVERVDGDYYTVVGLPLCDLATTLTTFGVDLL